MKQKNLRKLQAIKREVMAALIPKNIVLADPLNALNTENKVARTVNV